MLTLLFCRTMEHVAGDVQLIIPDLMDIVDPSLTDKEVISNHEIIKQLEEVIMSWERHITKVIEAQLAKTPVGNGPIPEFDYWHEREAVLSTLVEQLKNRNILKILSLLDKAENPIGSGFVYFKKELLKYFSEARENVKFLYSILRYLRVSRCYFKDPPDDISRCL